VIPEPITEGGFKFTGGRYDGEFYKTMRHHISAHKDHITGFNWPWIKDTTQEEWRVSDEEFISTGYHATTWLKAFQDAPAWTRDELLAIKDVLINYGIKCTNMPRNKVIRW
jgi:hypothetical protein